MLAALMAKIQDLLAGSTCPVWQLMSLLGLLTATEKQINLGRLHMRLIQLHLKNNCKVPESLEKVIPIPRSLQPHLRWWLEESNVLPGQPLYPLKHALQIFTDASKEGWGAHLNKRTALGTWSLPESKLHINYLAQDVCKNIIERRLLPEVFQTICNRWHQLQIDFFVTRLNNKLAQFVSPVPDLGSRCTQPVMEGSGPICLPTSSHLGQSGGQVAGLPMQENHPDCSRMAQHALGLGCSDYVQPDPTIQSDSIRNLSNLNLHAWLLKPQQSWTRASLRQWQHELRLIKEDQPDQSIETGPWVGGESPAGTYTWCYMS